MRTVASLLALGLVLASQTSWAAIAPVVTRIQPQTTVGATTIHLDLGITDADSPLESLSVTVTADFTSLIPAGGISVLRSGGSFRLAITPAPNQSGTAVITVTVSDPTGLSASTSFPMTVTPFDSPPEITPLPDQSILENGTLSAVTFFVADVESGFESLSTTGTSSNPKLVPPANILFSGVGFERRVVVRPAPDQFGSARITVKVSDPGGASSTSDFLLTVTPLNQPPTISAIGDVTIEVNSGATIAVPFVVSDKETPPDFLFVNASSSNTQLLPQSQLTLGGDGHYRVVRVTPAENQKGTSIITLTVHDLDGRTASTTFKLNVLATAPKPVIPDFNGDGLGDLLFQHREGFLATAFLDNSTLTGSSFFSPKQPGDGWELITTADFDGDKRPDLLFQNREGVLAIWSMNGVHQIGATLFTPTKPNEENWRVVSVADFYHDGSQDLLLQNSDGRMAVWLMNGTTLVNNAFLSPPKVADPAWHIVGTADLNGDGNPDLIFQHADGTLGAWFMSGLRMIEATLLEPGNPGDQGWRVVSIQDFDRDGHPDLLFQHTDGSLGIWYMNGIRLRSATLASPPNPGEPWRVVGPK